MILRNLFVTTNFLWYGTEFLVFLVLKLRVYLRRIQNFTQFSELKYIYTTKYLFIFYPEFQLTFLLQGENFFEDCFNIEIVFGRCLNVRTLPHLLPQEITSNDWLWSLSQSPNIYYLVIVKTMWALVCSCSVDLERLPGGVGHLPRPRLLVPLVTHQHDGTVRLAALDLYHNCCGEHQKE